MIQTGYVAIKEKTELGFWVFDRNDTRAKKGEAILLIDTGDLWPIPCDGLTLVPCFGPRAIYRWFPSEVF